MLSLEQKNKVKDILSDGLNIRKDINFPYYLGLIDKTYKEQKDLDSKMSKILYNQRIIDEKLDKILRQIG